MEKEFIPYEQALALKELGFDILCVGFYAPNLRSEGTILITAFDNYDFDVSQRITNRELSKRKIQPQLTAPLYQQAFDWLLKTHNLYSISIPTINMAWTFKTMTVVEGIIEVPPYKHVDATDYSTIEEADLERLKKLIELCQNIK